MAEIEFILLKLHVSVLGNDHLTVGLVLWDKKKLQFQFSTKMVKVIEQQYRKNIIQTIRYYNKALGNLQPKESQNLMEFFPWKTGFGSALSWESVTDYSTNNAEKTFQEFCNSFKLT